MTAFLDARRSTGDCVDDTDLKEANGDQVNQIKKQQGSMASGVGSSTGFK